jgi:hypothetical protein
VGTVRIHPELLVAMDGRVLGMKRGWYWVVLKGVDREGNGTPKQVLVIVEWDGGWMYNENFFQRHGIGDDAEFWLLQDAPIQPPGGRWTQ